MTRTLFPLSCGARYPSRKLDSLQVDKAKLRQPRLERLDLQALHSHSHSTARIYHSLQSTTSPQRHRQTSRSRSPRQVITMDDFQHRQVQHLAPRRIGSSARTRNGCLRRYQDGEIWGSAKQKNFGGSCMCRGCCGGFMVRSFLLFGGVGLSHKFVRPRRIRCGTDVPQNEPVADFGPIAVTEYRLDRMVYTPCTSAAQEMAIVQMRERNADWSQSLSAVCCICGFALADTSVTYGSPEYPKHMVQEKHYGRPLEVEKYWTCWTWSNPNHHLCPWSDVESEATSHPSPTAGERDDHSTSAPTTCLAAELDAVDIVQDWLDAVKADPEWREDWIAYGQ